MKRVFCDFCNLEIFHEFLNYALVDYKGKIVRVKPGFGESTSDDLGFGVKRSYDVCFTCASEIFVQYADVLKRITFASENDRLLRCGVRRRR